MKFDYSSIISIAPESNEYLLLRRPEIPVTILGPGGSMTVLGLVDTGSDNTIFPTSIARHLQISLAAESESTATVFSGERVQLEHGAVELRLDVNGESVAWRTVACFFDFDSPDQETVVLGHAGFLEFFTATFDGKAAVLTLLANDELPAGI